MGVSLHGGTPHFTPQVLIIFRCGKPMGLLGKLSILGKVVCPKNYVHQLTGNRLELHLSMRAQPTNARSLSPVGEPTWRIIPWVAMVSKSPTWGCGTPFPSGLNDLWVGVTNFLRTGMTPQVCFLRDWSKTKVKILCEAS